MPDTPHPIYGTPLPAIPAQAGIQTFPLWNRGRKKGYLTPTFWIPACAGMTII